MEKGNFLGINWQVRAKNPQFWLQIFLGVAVPIGTYFGVTGKDITSWNVLFGLIGQAISNPYVLAMVVVSVYNAVNDPSTKGVSDSGLAQTYTKPRDDKNPDEYAGFLNQEKDKEENVADGTKELVEYEKHEDSGEIDTYHMEDTEEFFKDESKPYGIDWEEELVDVNVNSTNKNDEKVDVKNED